jgi:hypothetical protein
MALFTARRLRVIPITGYACSTPIEDSGVRKPKNTVASTAANQRSIQFISWFDDSQLVGTRIGPAVLLFTARQIY